MKKRIIIGIVILVLGFISIFFIPKKKEYIINQDGYIIKAYSRGNININYLENLISDYEELTNRYTLIEHNLYYINYNDSDESYIDIDQKLYNMIEYSLEVKNITDGIIDSRSGNVFDIWNSYIQSEVNIPSIEELNSVNYLTDIVLLDGKILNNHANINLEYIKEEYITNEILLYFDEENIKDYIISTENRSIVGKMEETYKIGLINPNTNRFEDIVEGSNIQVVTVAPNIYKYNDINYNNIINSITLFPQTDVVSLIVIKKDSKINCTYIYSLVYSEAIKLVESDSNLEARWYLASGEIIQSSGFEDYLL